MANHNTGAQRRNKRMDKIFDRAKSEGRGLVGNSRQDNVGVNSPAMKEAKKSMAKKMNPSNRFVRNKKGEKVMKCEGHVGWCAEHQARHY